MTCFDFSGLARRSRVLAWLAKARHVPAIFVRTHGAGLLVVAAALPAGAQPREPRDSRDWEGAVGLVVGHGPAYPGAADESTKLTPAGFLRWGRFTLTGAGGFTTRRQDDVERGLGAELVRQPRLRVRLGLRMDNGRRESDSPRLAGLGEIERTLRARLSAQWEVAEHWRLGAGLSVDALNRGGGYLVDLSLAREFMLPHDATLTVSAALVGAGDRYMQAWHGITPEQSRRSGLPVHTAAEGLRQVQFGAVWRAELAHRWAGFAGLGVTQLVGPASDSPLTERATGVHGSAGLVWRF